MEGGLLDSLLDSMESLEPVIEAVPDTDYPDEPKKKGFSTQKPPNHNKSSAADLFSLLVQLRQNAQQPLTSLDPKLVRDCNTFAHP